jgi:Family of unknown function (DUF5681)
MSLFNDEDTEIGYAKPPVHSRFRKGQSGNPQGRPKGRLNIATVLEKTLHEKVVINENGRRRTITKLEAAVKQLVNKAATGDLRALHHLTALAKSAEEKSVAAEANEPQEEMGASDQKILQGILSRFGGESPDD